MKWKIEKIKEKIEYEELKLKTADSKTFRLANFYLGSIKYRAVLVNKDGYFKFGVGIPGKTFITRYKVKKFDLEIILYETIKFALGLESYEVEDRKNKIPEMVFI